MHPVRGYTKCPFINQTTIIDLVGLEKFQVPIKHTSGLMGPGVQQGSPILSPVNIHKDPRTGEKKGLTKREKKKESVKGPIIIKGIRFWECDRMKEREVMKIQTGVFS